MPQPQLNPKASSRVHDYVGHRSAALTVPAGGLGQIEDELQPCVDLRHEPCGELAVTCGEDIPLERAQLHDVRDRILRQAGARCGHESIAGRLDETELGHRSPLQFEQGVTSPRVHGTRNSSNHRCYQSALTRKCLRAIDGRVFPACYRHRSVHFYFTEN